ncbi:DUF1903-domain-containing protein [Sporormia fimetaria CBS 119925]|uniref:Cx9C motif-containing protein 4, mitochondrial n=1 Tax=Sporormia fimetaria CBS 119925 TaxID=1340428 RepID=A0A6A6V101_9PLEO|nr:DUF1903-domain-containing protein [Sporormia fimetaria CBS 119925]
MGLKEDLQTDPACHPRACAIQSELYCRFNFKPLDLQPDCLLKNNYNEDKCRKEVDALYECCNAFYEKNGDQASVVSCPKASLLRLKMKQRASGS